MDGLRKSIAAEAAKSTAVKPKVRPAENIASTEAESSVEAEGQSSGRRPCDGRAEDAKSQVTCIAMTLLVMWLLASPVA